MRLFRRFSNTVGRYFLETLGWEDDFVRYDQVRPLLDRWGRFIFHG